MNKSISLGLLIGLLSACATQAPKAPPEPRPSVNAAGPLAPVGEADRVELTFLNSDIFDRELSRHMSAAWQRIRVDVAGNFSLDVVPDRIEKWMAAVQASDGLVRAEALPDPAAPSTRSAELIALIQVAVSYFNNADEAASSAADYAAASAYHARLYYERDSGNVTTVVFHRR